MARPFSRVNLFVASDSEVVVKALACSLEWFRGEGGNKFPHYFPLDHVIAAKSADDICARLDAVQPQDLLHSVCVVELPPDKSSSWDIRQSEGCPLRPSELLLRYPEVYWIFVVPGKNYFSSNNLPDAAREHHLVSFDENVITNLVMRLGWHANGFRSWFDPTGLRKAVQGEELGKETAHKQGAAIDDELTFVTLNGYVLYRSHHSTYLVNTVAEMKRVLKFDAPQLKEYEQPWTTMEDLELNFADLPPNAKEKGEAYLGTFTRRAGDNQEKIKAVLESRSENFSLIRGAARIVVSSASITAEALPAGIRSVLKPYSGMYDKNLGIGNQTKCPVSPSTANCAHPVGPTRAQQIAESLIERARNLERSATTTISAIHAALLAHEARHLLGGGPSLALSFESIAIQHRMEVTAECAFIGSSSKLAVNERLDAIMTDIVAVAGGASLGIRDRTLGVLLGIYKAAKYRLHAGKAGIVALADGADKHTASLGIRDRIRRTYRTANDHHDAIKKETIEGRRKTYQVNNAFLEICDGIRRIYRAYDQFLEEEEALRRVRKVESQLRYKNKRPETSWKIFELLWDQISFGAERYLQKLLTGFICIFFSIAFWIVVFAAYFWLLEARQIICSNANIFRWLAHSAVTFFALQQGIAGDPKGDGAPEIVIFDETGFYWFWAGTVLEMMLGILHNGILIAYIYQKISRR